MTSLKEVMLVYDIKKKMLKYRTCPCGEKIPFNENITISGENINEILSKGLSVLNNWNDKNKTVYCESCSKEYYPKLTRKPCSNCESKDVELYNCHACQEDFCVECAVTCESCDYIFCSECFTHHINNSDSIDLESEYDKFKREIEVSNLPDKVKNLVLSKISEYEFN